MTGPAETPRNSDSPFSATGICTVRIRTARRHTGRVKIIDETLSLDLLSTQQHHEIAPWLRIAATPEAIMAMPPHLLAARAQSTG